MFCMETKHDSTVLLSLLDFFTSLNLDTSPVKIKLLSESQKLQTLIKIVVRISLDYISVTCPHMKMVFKLTLLHSERPKLYTILAFLSAVVLL